MRRSHALTVLTLGSVFLLALAGCGGQGTPAPTTEPIPTPQGVFGQATSVITPGAAATPTPAMAGPDLALGQRVWDGKCASCHGAKGEGVADKGKGIAGWQFSAQEFEDLLRTGQKGQLGNEHLYGPSQISPSGIAGLYGYLQSLSGQ